MSFMSKNKTRPLFVNSLQLQQYGCSSRESPAVSDAGRDQWNIFGRFSSGTGVVAKQSSKDRADDIESSYTPDCKPSVINSVSPIFNKQILPKSLPLSSRNSLTVDSMRTAGKNSILTPHVPVDHNSDLPSSSDSEDSDHASPVQCRKRQRRRIRQLIDSDSSDSDVKVRESSSAYSVNSESWQNKTAAESRIQKLSALEHRHCFDLLLNSDSGDAVRNSDFVQSLQKGRSERLQRNDMCTQSVKSFSRSPESFDRKTADKSDITGVTGEVGVLSVSSPCSVCLHKLQLQDVPCRIILSQEDKQTLSGRCSSAVSSQTSTVNGNVELPASDDLIRLSGAGVTHPSANESSDVHYSSGDDMFSDDELVESVCLSPGRYNAKDDTICHDISTVSDKHLESAVTCKEPEVLFVSYSQADDDCILIDDSDDELFANLTQSDITVKVEPVDDHEDDEGHQSDDHEDCGSADDENWLPDDVDCVAAAGSTFHVGSTPVTSETYDPWINDMDDVSSDELEAAYDAAMVSHAVHAEGSDAVHTDSAAVRHQLRHGDDDLKLLNHITNHTCSVSLKPLRMTDISTEIRICERDSVVVDEETDSDSDSVTSSESVQSTSMTCQVNIDTKYKDEDKALPVTVDVYHKPDTVLKSADLTEFVDCQKLACTETTTTHERESDSSAMEVDKWYQTSSKHGILEKNDKLSSACDTDEVIENIDIKCKHDKRNKSTRVALENCVEVAEFYGKIVKTVEKEDRSQKREMTAVNGTRDMDTLVNTENRNYAKPSCTKKDQSHLTVAAPLHMESQKSVKRVDDSDCKAEEWKSKSLMQRTNKQTSSVQYQKIAQMRDSDKQKLRKDKPSSMSARRQSDDNNDRFMGLSQISVAKQQLLERNRQLKDNGLYYAVCPYCFKICVKCAVILILHTHSSNILWPADFFCWYIIYI